MKFNVKKDRIEIKNIIFRNLKLIEMAKNKERVCQDIADAILVYLIEEEKGCGKYYTRGAYTFTCGESSKAGKIQYCKECMLKEKKTNRRKGNERQRT